MYPSSPKLPSHLGCHITLSRVCYTLGPCWVIHFKNSSVYTSIPNWLCVFKQICRIVKLLNTVPEGAIKEVSFLTSTDKIPQAGHQGGKADPRTIYIHRNFLTNQQAQRAGRTDYTCKGYISMVGKDGAGWQRVVYPGKGLFSLFLVSPASPQRRCLLH